MKKIYYSIFGTADETDNASLARFVNSFFIVATISLLVSCETPNEPWVPNIAGTWTGVLWGSVKKDTLTLTIFQDGNKIWGRETLASGLSGRIVGTMKGELCEYTFSMTNYSSDECSYRYVVLYHGNTASGTYYTSGCSVKTSGKLYLTKVQ